MIKDPLLHPTLSSLDRWTALLIRVNRNQTLIVKTRSSSITQFTIINQPKFRSC